MINWKFWMQSRTESRRTWCWQSVGGRGGDGRAGCAGSGGPWRRCSPRAETPGSLGKVTARQAGGLGQRSAQGRGLAWNAAVGDGRCCTKGVPDVKTRVGVSVFLKLSTLLPKYFLKHFPDSVENQTKLHCCFTLLIPSVHSSWSQHKNTYIRRTQRLRKDQAAWAGKSSPPPAPGRRTLGLALPWGPEGLSDVGIAGPRFWRFTALQLLLSAALQSLLSGFELWSFTCRRLWP